MDDTINTPKPSPLETIKEKSNYLRGTLNESLSDPLTGAIRSDDQVLIKFHGTYQQQDRDLDSERKRQKLEPLYSFLIRVRVPGGVATPEQWLAMDALSEKYGDHTLKFTTRQAFQFHGVLKRNLKTTIKGINKSLLDTIAACGDVNRNVMCSANPFESPIHAEVAEDAKRISAHLTPQTNAYHEIWLDGKLIEGGEKEEEPLYGKTYLPRKFKIAIAVPPRNDTDVLSNDLGFIAIVESGILTGYNVSVGGGMAYTFGNKNTYPRIGDIVGYVPKEKVVEAAEAVLIFQRDHGNRSERKNARLKYTIDRLGLDFFRSEIERVSGIIMEPAREYKFITMGDKYGWTKSHDGFWHYTVFVEGGKLVDRDGYLAKTAIREIAAVHTGLFILTGNQNVVIARVSESQKQEINALLLKHHIIQADSISKLRQNSIACAALPYCGLAFAEAERYLPSLITKIDKVLEANGILQVPISIRMTGCPNGCGRPYLAEIGFVGKSEGHYNLYLGGNFIGSRLNTLFKETLTEAEILNELTPIITDFAENRLLGEKFGDFVIRNQYVKETLQGIDFRH